jgi:hypothetical protein
VACRTPAPTAPLAAGSALAAWIPSDVAMVIAVAPGGSADLDALAAALELPEPGAHVALPDEVAAAWPDARGALWMLLAIETATIARCARVGDAARAAAALGGQPQRSGDAILVEHGEVTVVLRGGAGCAVSGGAASVRARHALRLATLGDDERLLRARPEVRAALEALPDAEVTAWGAGPVIAGGLGGGLALSGELAIAASMAGRTLRIEASAPAARAAQVPLGGLAVPPPIEPLPPLPRPPIDENTDVPESAEYRAAVSAMAQLLADAVEVAGAVQAAEEAARAAWIAAWGEVAVAPDGERTVVTWTPPAWPPSRLRADADAALAAARAPIAEPRARYQALVDEAAAKVPALIKIRARDVAAWDRAQR